MVRNAQERILLIADSRREMEAALSSAVPSAQVTRVENFFDGIAELSGSSYSAVVAAAEPIERRPEAAVRTLRSLAGEGRIILFGDAALETVSRKMLEFGSDDYVITPASSNDVQQIFNAPLMRIAAKPVAQPQPNAAHSNPSQPNAGPAAPTVADPLAPLSFDLRLADMLLDAIVLHPGNATAAFVQIVNPVIAPLQLRYQPPEQSAMPAIDGMRNISQPIVATGQPAGTAHLAFPASEPADAHTAFLAHLGQILGKVAATQEQHRRLQQLAIKDQLTQVYNRRYFEHFLARILEKAKTMRFAVTLLLFDIDNFKKYNDEFGHGLGDEILRETAALMKRCSREHDLVARIGGDEFAVVFWEKESPRQPKDPSVLPSARLPQEPLAILRRFHRLLTSKEFQGLGPTGRGCLTISGGLASYPWDGRNVQELVEAADQNLVQGAKKAGKNSIFLVGGDSLSLGDEEPPKPAP